MKTRPIITATILAAGALAPVAVACTGSVTEPDVAENVNALYESVAFPADSFAMGQPEDVDVNELLFRPTRQEY
jgi:hypothetical protein